MKLDCTSFHLLHAARSAKAVKSCEAAFSGIDVDLIRAQTLDEYHAELVRLTEDAELRLAVGRRTRCNILRTNMGERWLRAVGEVYEKALSVPQRHPAAQKLEPPNFSDLDLFTPYVFGHLDLGDTQTRRWVSAVEGDLRLFPFWQRLRIWASVTLRRGWVYRGNGRAVAYLLPEWFSCRARDLFRLRRSK